MAGERTESRRRAASGWPVRLVSSVVLVAAVVTICVAVVVPRLAGASPYTVLTGSMAPAYPPGTLVVVRPVEPEDVAVGDVVTYQLRSGRPEVVTHRVVETAVGTTTGDYEYVTRGDSNQVSDPASVRPAQLKGEVWYAVPHLGRLSTLLSGEQRRVGELVLAAGLALYAATMFVLTARQRRGREDSR
jgi:signal peptidase